MLRIRLQRLGRRNQPFYRLVVAEHSTPVKGAYMELLGHYNPLRTPKVVELKKERIQYWVTVGAQPSETVARMLVKNGLTEMQKFFKERKMKPSKAEVEAKKRHEEEQAAKKAAAEAAKLEAEKPVEAPVAEVQEEPASSEEAPTDTAPVEEVAAESAPVEEAPATEAPEETAPETPIEDVPAEETPAEEQA